MYKEYIVLDVETTGVDAKHDDIIEFAGVKLNEQGEVVDKLDMFISTDQPISPVVTALTGITEQNLQNQPTIDDVRDKIVAFIGEAPIVGHNIGFDIDFLNSHGCNLKNPSLDTLELAYTVLPAQSYYSLEYLSRHFSFPNQPSHRAMNDVLATVDLFKLLVTQITSWSDSTKTSITKLIPEDSWTWAWAIANPPAFAPFDFKEMDDRQKRADKIVQEIKTADQWVDQINQAKSGAINLIEAHFKVDPLALTCAYGLRIKPTILVVDQAEFWKTDWDKLARGLKIKLFRFFGTKTLYDEGAEMRLVESGKPLSSLEARLITKVLVWKQERKQDPAKLFMPLEERYQWEQKLSPLTLQTPPPEFDSADIIVAPAQALSEIANLERFEIITTQPLLLEDYAVFDRARVFSVPYFSAAISSRRDFVHQYIRPQNIKLADELFKILHHISSNLNKLSDKFTATYAANPPQSVYERDIELDANMLDSECKELLQEVTKDLQDYLDRLEELNTTNLAGQVEQTKRLLGHLSALKDLTADFRYFLYADQNRFFLELMPSQINFEGLQDIIKKSRGLTVIAPSLSVAGKFDYFMPIFGALNGKILPPASKTELLLVDEAGEQVLSNFVSQLLMRDEKSLILANSAFAAKDMFDQLFVDASEGTLESYDTIGNALNVSNVAASRKKFALVGHYHWFKQIKWHRGGFDRIVLGKMPFDPISRPRFKILGGDRNGFESYILPRAIMRLKETLHLVGLWEKPLVLIDKRLTSKEYGQKVINSLNGFMVVPTKSDEALQ